MRSHVRSSLRLCLVGITLVIAGHEISAQSTAYWRDEDGLRRARITDGDQEVLIDRMVSPQAIAVDRSTGMLYWSELFTGKIKRAPLGSRNATELVVGSANARGVDVDETSRFLYWTDHDYGRIRRVSLDGNSVETVVLFAGEPMEVVVHEQSGTLFWSTDDTITKVDLDTRSSAEVVFDAAIVGVATDETDNTLYWSTAAGIHRADFDGSGSTIVLPTSSIPNTEGFNVRPLSIDIDGGRVYWLSDRGYFGNVMSAQTDGSDIRVETDTGVPTILGPPYIPLDIDVFSGELVWTTSPYSGLGEIFEDSQIFRKESSETEATFAIRHRYPWKFFPDEANGDLYWVQSWPRYAYGDYVVIRSPVDDLGTEEVLASGAGSLAYVWDLAIDQEYGSVYLQGSAGPQPMILPGVYWLPGSGSGAAVDTVGGYVYFSDCSTIQRLPVPDGDPEIVLTDVGTFLPDCADDLAVDPIRRWLYWRRQNAIWRYSLNSGKTNVVAEFGGPTEPGSGFGLSGLAVEPISGNIYWLDNDVVYRADADGTNVEELWYAGPWSSDLFVVAAPSELASPNSLDPANGDEGISTSYTMSWSTVPGATSYEIEIASLDSQNPFLKVQVASTSYEFIAPIAEWSYRWRVQARANAQNGSWSAWAEFTTGASGPLAPLAVAPSDGAVDVEIPALVQWGAAPEAVRYHVQVAGNMGFVKPHAINDTLVALEASVSDLSPNETYFWRVRGISADGKFTWTKARMFTTAASGVSVESRTEIPDRIWIAPVSPNPAQGSTRLEFGLPDRRHVTVELVDLLGRVVQTLLSEEAGRGVHIVWWTPRVSAGTYIIRATAEGATATSFVSVIGS